MQSPGYSEPMAQQSGSGSNSQAGERSPLSNAPFLKQQTKEEKQTKDGSQPKRRGPKPDSKPALTRRQELNRQAQRTHRERKEMYIKALEQEVLRLKDVYTETTRERDTVQQENTRLKALLSQHGISYDFGDAPIRFQREPSGGVISNRPSNGPSSSGSISGSYPPASSESTGRSPHQSGQPLQMPDMQTYGGTMQPTQRRDNATTQSSTNRVDYDQIGIDFVLTLERPCMEHLQYLVVRSHNSDEQEFHHPNENSDDRDHDHMSGHALMATCTPYTHVVNKPNEPYPFQMPEMSTPDLIRLLDLSARLPLNHGSEITPVMAWTQIFKDPRIGEMSTEDFERLKLDLGAKVRCYGFGAVLEEFEVRDAIGSVHMARAGPGQQSAIVLPRVPFMVAA